jgi:hypothetical protein
MYVENEDSISDMLSEELSIDSDDERNFENEGQSASKESSNAPSESECESETSVVRMDGWEDVTIGDKKPVAYTFTKNAGRRFDLIPHTEPIDYFSIMSF